MLDERWLAFVQPVLPSGWTLRPQLPFAFQQKQQPVIWTPVSGTVDGATRTDCLTSPDGLQLTCRTTRHDAEHTLVIKLELTNTTAQPTLPIDRIEPLRLRVATAAQPARSRVVAGGFNEKLYPPHAFRHETLRHQHGGFAWTENGWDGRSSDRSLPFLTVVAGAGGLVFALEWSGLWWGSVAGPRHHELVASIHIPVRGLILAPGETLSLPAAHYVFSHADGLDGATNAFRRYLNRKVLPAVITPPASYDHWFGIGPGITEETFLARVAVAAELGLEYCVLDAGWYPGCTSSDFEAGLGNLAQVDPAKFPRGLEYVAQRVRDHGMKFGLWFEFERAHRASVWAQTHPEWFIDIGTSYLHTNLARRDAQDACIALLSDAVARLGLAWVKLDSNLGPLAFWKAHDPTGKIQFAALAGLERVLDEVRRRHPDLIIECCASGGRRIDLAMLRRAHTAWISDECMHAENTRFMQIGASALLPGQLLNSGLPFGRDEGQQSFDDCEVLSRMVGAFQVNGDVALLSAERRARLRALVTLYKRFRHLLPQDFYSILPQPRDDQDWQAAQFVSADRTECVVLAFSGAEPAGVSAPSLRLQGLDLQSSYQIETLHAPTDRHTRSGADLHEAGLCQALPPRSWAGWLLRRV